MTLIWSPPTTSPIPCTAGAASVVSIMASLTAANGQSACVPVPLSARERKQVYSHSAIFVADPMPVYSIERQRELLGEVQRQYMPRRGPPPVALPSPGDMRATVNAGHGVLLWDKPVPISRSASVAAFVQFNGQGELTPVVHHCSQDHLFHGSRERGTLCGREQKYNDLSSTIFGGDAARHVPMARSQSLQEVRSDQGQRVYVIDSLCDRTSHERQPTSARGRKVQWLDASVESQFASPRKATAVGATDAAAEEISRRRAERNFSDIFGRASQTEVHNVRRPVLIEAPSPRSTAGVGTADLMTPRHQKAKAVEAVADAGFEVYRPHVSARLRAPLRGSAAAAAKEADEQVTPLTPRARRCMVDAEAKREFDSQRACWDTRIGMESGAELARLRHERRLARSSSARVGECLDAAVGRKRRELGSQSLRRCWGDEMPPEHQDTCPPSPSKRTAGIVSVQFCQPTCPPPGSPLHRARSAALNAARSRKLLDLRSSGIF